MAKKNILRKTDPVRVIRGAFKGREGIISFKSEKESMVKLKGFIFPAFETIPNIYLRKKKKVK